MPLVFDQLLLVQDISWDRVLFCARAQSLNDALWQYLVLTIRKPMLLLRLSGVLLLRFAERTFLALLFQLPPRITRFELESGNTLITGNR